jgi:hypothetical protein
MWSAGFSRRMISDLASMPVFRAFCEDSRLPSGVLGPVDFLALMRLARIWFSVAMMVFRILFSWFGN